MAFELPDYPNIEEALFLTFERDLEGFDGPNNPRLGSEAPDEFDDDMLPFVRVEQIDGVTLRLSDHPIVDIDVYARTRSEARSISKRISTLLFSYPGMVVVGTRGVKFDSVECTRSPVRAPYDDDTVRRFGATYNISVRR